MSSTIYSVITGTGCYIPTECIGNDDFLNKQFFGSDRKPLDTSNREIVDKFLEITTIKERRYASQELMTSDIAFYAAEAAIENAGIDRERLDYVIVAHNFGDQKKGSNRTQLVPSVASKVKHLLKIKNPETVAYDVIFGCPGWVQAIIQADYYIKSGDAKNILVIGADMLSGMCDPHDRDSMIFADGAGAVVLEGKTSSSPIGILTHKARTDSLLYSKMLTLGESLNAECENKDDIYIRMNGRRLYQYALDTVPQAIKACLDKCGLDIKDVKKVLLHQANGKMDDAILERLYSLYGSEAPANVMPMTISWLGNSSVATVPTLLDLILRSKMEGHTLLKDDIVVFASVGAGMSINAVVYRMA